MFLVVIHTFIQPERVCRKFFGHRTNFIIWRCFLCILSTSLIVLIDRTLACCRALNVNIVVKCLCAASVKGVDYIE